MDKNRQCGVAVERVYEKVKLRDLGKKKMSQQERFDLRWLKNENYEPKDQAALLRTLGDGHDKYLRMYETLSAGVPAGNAITCGLLVGEFQLDRAASPSHAPLLNAAGVTGATTFYYSFLGPRDSLLCRYKARGCHAGAG